MRDEKGFFYALGKNGLRWMKIHLANLFGHGVDKLSYDRRVAFAENHMDDVFDSADRPLEGKSWWLGSKDPFQCLAVCINLAEAWRSSSPETTISYLPVHQDGSCNGLQHYAALGRDKLGAESVNLVAGEKPADVYSGIAERVCDIMRRDAQKDSATDPNVARAKLLLDQVDRKLVKQTVMTSVYGVTFIGARDQIKRRLAEQGAISDEKERYLAACYVAKVTLTALGQMFEAARAIMTWLRECAKHVLDYDLRKGEPHNCLEDACAAMKLLTKLEHGFDDTITAPNLEVRLKLVSVWLPLFIVCRDKNASPLLSNLFLRIIPQNHSEETFLIMTLPLPMSHSETLLH